MEIKSQIEVKDPDSRKRWAYVLTAVFITYSLAYLDRANYGLGAAAGLAVTLHITASQSALLGALFFLGYFIFQVPGMAYARRHSSTRIIFAALLVWGALAALTGVIRLFWLLALDRFLLGVAESVIFPAMLVLITKWFTREERSRANTLLMLGNPITVLWMSIVTGYLIHSLGWQLTFVVEGLPSIVWAFVWIRIIRDEPATASWMSIEGSKALEQKLASEQLLLTPVRNWRQAFARKDVVLLSVVYFCWSLGVYGFVLWLPTILRAGNAMGIEKTGLLAAVPYLLAVILMLLASHFSDRSLRRRSVIWPSLILSGVALFASFLMAGHSFWFGYLALILAGGTMYAPYGSFFALISESIPRNVLDEVLGLINSSGALGGFAGAWLVGLLQARTGDSRAGFLLMSGGLIGSGLLMLTFPAKAAPATATGAA